MITTLSLLLILLFILGFWIVKGSPVPMFIKVLTISLFFAFCVMMAATLDSSMGWAAMGKPGKNIPEIVTIRSVVIREPNQSLGFDGSIYLLLDMSENKTDSTLLRLFGHTPEGIEPRLYRLPYSRSFHEQLQKNVIPRLLKGQSVTGKLKAGKPGEGADGEEGDADGDGESNGQRGRRGQHGNGRGNPGPGGDKRDTEFHFYNLPPSQAQPKNYNQ